MPSTAVPTIDLYVGELANWRVQKLTLHAGAARPRG